jgi:Na+/H+-translocating membrane pyrophosphatase
LNTATGATLAVGAYGPLSPNIAGLAFMSEAPEASTYIALMVGLTLMVGVRRRRSL